MATIAKIANGTLLKMGDGASPEVFTTIPEVVRLTGPQIKFDLLDVTSHDSLDGFREFIAGLADGDVVAGHVNWRPSNTVHKNVRVAQYARTLKNFKIVFPDTADNTVSLSAWIQTWGPKADVGTPLLSDFSFKVTGEPTWA